MKCNSHTSHFHLTLYKNEKKKKEQPILSVKIKTMVMLETIQDFLQLVQKEKHSLQFAGGDRGGGAASSPYFNPPASTSSFYFLKFNPNPNPLPLQ